MKGQVVKIRSDKYFVKSENGLFVCSARGGLRIKSDGIVTGDYIEFDEKKLTVDKLLPRKNLFYRPNVANVDAVNVVVACPPPPDFLMLDKLIVSLCSEKVQVYISVNKTDVNNDTFDRVKRDYAMAGFSVYSVSAKTGEGIEALKNEFKGKLVAFAGQSAVGKSSLLNALFGLELKTGDVSEKTLRGKHTTTAAEIFEKDGVRIVDTPGFSVITPNLLPEELGLFYPEYFAKLQECKYRGCTHTGEPGCAVQKAVETGELCRERYLRYKAIFEELKEIQSKKY